LKEKEKEKEKKRKERIGKSNNQIIMFLLFIIL
jgi:hypothetical protein